MFQVSSRKGIHFQQWRLLASQSITCLLAYPYFRLSIMRKLWRPGSVLSSGENWIRGSKFIRCLLPVSCTHFAGGHTCWTPISKAEVLQVIGGLECSGVDSERREEDRHGTSWLQVLWKIQTVLPTANPFMTFPYFLSSPRTGSSIWISWRPDHQGPIGPACKQRLVIQVQRLQ